MSVLVYAVNIICYALLAAIFVRVAFSWIGPDPRNRIYRLSYDLTEPFLRPVRQILPMGPGLDFSPMIVSLILFFILNFVGRL
jgi:YggT family protein